MTDQSQDRLEGSFDEAKGRGQEALGKLSDDKSTQMDGQKDQALGNATLGRADAKYNADDVLKDVKTRDNR